MKNEKCLSCGSSTSLIHIFKKGTSIGTSEDFSKKMICTDCLDDSDDYSYCELCGEEEGAYRIRDLSDGYCAEHYDEVTPVDDDEADAWESLAEYYSDPSH